MNMWLSDEIILRCKTFFLKRCDMTWLTNLWYDSLICDMTWLINMLRVMTRNTSDHPSGLDTHHLHHLECHGTRDLILWCKIFFFLSVKMRCCVSRWWVTRLLMHYQMMQDHLECYDEVLRVKMMSVKMRCCHSRWWVWLGVEGGRHSYSWHSKDFWCIILWCKIILRVLQHCNTL